MKRYWLVLLCVPFLTACASDVRVSYPHPVEASETGRVVVRLSEPMQTVTVMIDGSLVAEDEHTKRVEIQNVPIGEREIQVIASEQWRSRSVNHRDTVTVEPNRDGVVLIDTPPYSPGYWALMAVLWLVAFTPTAVIF